MNSEILIQIDWPWALGIFGLLIVIAWKGSSRFTRIETDIDWLKEAVKELKNDSENEEIGVFASASPVALTPKGNNLLIGSGIKKYIEENEEDLVGVCKKNKETNAYEVQKFVFNYFDEVVFGEEYDKKIKDYAYGQGISTDIIRRVGAIHLRDICLREFEMNAEDIDSHNTN